MRKTLLLISALIFLASCGGRNNNFDVDVSAIDPKVELTRFDLDFRSISPDSVYSAIPPMRQKYGDFFDLYTEGIIGLPPADNADFGSRFMDFADYCRMYSVYKEIDKVFPDTEDLAPLFSDGFRHFRYYFPADTLPKIYTVVAGFQESVFPTDDIVAMSLEKYLGSGFSATYESLGIENYKRIKMCREMLPVDFFTTYALLNYPKSPDNADNLLNEMIYQGRLQFFLKCLMPNTPDHILWGYTPINYQWADAYESNVWNYLVDKKLLFDNNPQLIRSLTGPGPFTNAFGNESAPGVASFCGYGIVCSYMANHPEVSLQKLMQITDLQSIYNMSRYNP